MKDTMLRYQSVFYTAMVDMLYFDSQGILRRLNDKACSTFRCHCEELLKRRVNVYEFFGLPYDEYQMEDIFHATITVDLPETDGQSAESVWYELKLMPVFDDQNRLQGIYATGLEVSDECRFSQMQREALKRLNKANEKVSRYIDNINYVLQVGGMRLVSYNPFTHLLFVYSNISTVQHQLTQTRAMQYLKIASRSAAHQAFSSMDNLSRTTVELTVKTFLNIQGRPLFLQLNFIPQYDEQGQVKEYVGVCRNVSELKITEEQLQQETERARDVETVKNAFLRNMNYEIRTPLNSIVGFAEFFQQPHAPEDELVFVNEIKDNSASLLKLINNILFLSRLDARMIEINPQPVDFALFFDGMVQNCWVACHQDQEPKVEFKTENPYNRLVITVDSKNIEHIMEQLIANSVRHTEKGYVRARYDYTGDLLVVMVEDTGGGVPAGLMDHIFDRFATGAAKGTGLGLSICYELATQMGGSIHIKSEEDRGTTVWLSLPCAASIVERK